MFKTRQAASWIAFLLLLLGLVPSVAHASCTKIQRKAWHQMSTAEKTDYLNAEVCLMKKPAKLGLSVAKSRFDDLTAVHQALARNIHGTGSFLPWHRLYMKAHERMLRDECGYRGGQPYWDETRDSGAFTTASVFTAQPGFGGNGQGPSMCVPDGPFAGLNISVGPGWLATDRCISRRINNGPSVQTTQDNLNACNQFHTYGIAWSCFYLAPHQGCHGGVGGTMADPFTSPGDPIFFLHHTWLDKAWWDWQKRDLPSRLTDISGPNNQNPSVGFPEFPGNVTYEDILFGRPADPNWVDVIPPVAGDPGTVTTLDHVLDTLGLLPNATIRDVMDIRGDYLCVEYL